MNNPGSKSNAQLLLIALACCSLALGCSSAASPTTGGGSNSGSTSGGSGSTGSSASTGGSTGSAPAYSGTVEFTSIIELDGGRPSLVPGVLAIFTSPRAPIRGCVDQGGTQVGNCCYAPFGGLPARDAGPAPTLVSAGDIHIAVGGVDGGTLVFATDGGAYGNGVPLSFFGPGLELSASADGDVIHAFSGTVNVAPELTGLSPGSGSTVSVSPGASIDVTWTATSVGSVGLQATVKQGTTLTGNLTCSGAGADGRIHIDASLLGLIPSGATAQVGLRLSNLDDVSPDNASVQVISSFPSTQSFAMDFQ